METVRILVLAGMRPGLQRRLYEAQQEAARVWTLCRDLHLAARQHHTRWPDRDDLHAGHQRPVCPAQPDRADGLPPVPGQCGDGSRTAHRPIARSAIPTRTSASIRCIWPAQAVSVERGRIVLPMGRGRPSLVFKLDLPEHIGGCKLVWKDGYELHVSVPAAPAPAAPGAVQATVDLGEIHQAAVTTNTGAALVVSGRGIRSLKRRHHMALGQLARKRKRCQPGSRRSRKLWACPAQGERPQTAADPGRCATKGTRKVIAFCQEQQRGHASSSATPMAYASGTADAITTNAWPRGNTGRTSPTSPTKRTAASIESFTGSERGTSSQCPVCGWKQKVRGRQWRCRNPQCSFQGHRDVVGSVNMHPLAFGTKIAFPAHITYQRAGPVRVLAAG